ncbi:hypothetical protein EXIGLDRAFT_722465 [Exidia glandulosa HHB12029]|uniref:Uncharacterized protein n=1 Tax=Exidia glandulosa HHB12029 TaxID=1314781 RepID=A0A165FAN9_EXIGL|nr:hypothetical protein EXIGLDRAFT_722465 [Exidia glandulosa HHB12029]
MAANIDLDDRDDYEEQPWRKITLENKDYLLKKKPLLPHLHPPIRGGNFDPFISWKNITFAGNEDGLLLPYGIRFHQLLAILCEVRSLTDLQALQFRQLSQEIRRRTLLLPEAEGQGRDNLDGGRPYTITRGHKWKYGLAIERREYEDGLGVQVWFSIRPQNYFYMNPEGDYYCHYEAITAGGIKDRGINFAANVVKRYEYPPDSYTRDRGGQAARF